MGSRHLRNTPGLVGAGINTGGPSTVAEFWHNHLIKMWRCNLVHVHVCVGTLQPGAGQVRCGGEQWVQEYVRD